MGNLPFQHTELDQGQLDGGLIESRLVILLQPCLFPNKTNHSHPKQIVIPPMIHMSFSTNTPFQIGPTVVLVNICVYFQTGTWRAV